MASTHKRKTGEHPLKEAEAGWPVWARAVLSIALVLHGAALLSGALAAADNASFIERSVANAFVPYHQLIDQGYTYRYYAPEPGPTPVVTAVIHYGTDRPDEEERLPGRGVWPRLRYQRQLALANHLFSDFARTRQEGGESLWARSYARHLARIHPGAKSIALYLRMHLIPDPGRIAVESRDSKIDLDADEYFTTPERIGEFACVDL
jgi:hypothetical protein